MVMDLQLIVAVVFFLWLTILTILFLRIYFHYNNLLKGASRKTLKSVLEDLLGEINITKQDINNLLSRCETLEKKELLHIQKIGLLRFNPFKDTGGDQSFVLVFADANDTGVVITGLYSRTGTRWYAKRIISGKGVEHDLSEEEKKAIKETKILE